MKKLALLFIIGMLSNHFIFANTESRIMNTRPDVVITIRLNLHSKKQDCNAGFGFCKISITLSWEDKVNPGEEIVFAKASINAQNQLIIKLNETDLKNYDNGTSLKYFVGKKSVYIDADYEITSDVCNALGSSAPITIKEGNYPISYDKGIYTLLIAL